MIGAIDRYGEAIEWDLHERLGLDLVALVRSRSWAKLARLIDRLPSDSHYMAAIAEDDEVAEAWLRANPESGEKRRAGVRPKWTDMSAEAQLLMAVVERLDTLSHQVGGIEKPPKPLPRPASALERVRRRMVERSHEALVAEVREAQQRWKERHASSR